MGIDVIWPKIDSGINKNLRKNTNSSVSNTHTHTIIIHINTIYTQIYTEASQETMILVFLQKFLIFLFYYVGVTAFVAYLYFNYIIYLLEQNFIFNALSPPPSIIKPSYDIIIGKAQSTKTHFNSIK